MKNRHSTQRSFPGRLMLEDWLALSGFARRDLTHRAQCGMLHGHAPCPSKQCRRHRACCADDAAECERTLWQRALRKPRPLRRELARLYRLTTLRGQERETYRNALSSFSWTAGLNDPWIAPDVFPGATAMKNLSSPGMADDLVIAEANRFAQMQVNRDAPLSRGMTK